MFNKILLGLASLFNLLGYFSKLSKDVCKILYSMKLINIHNGKVEINISIFILFYKKNLNLPYISYILINSKYAI